MASQRAPQRVHKSIRASKSHFTPADRTLSCACLRAGSPPSRRPLIGSLICSQLVQTFICLRNKRLPRSVFARPLSRSRSWHSFEAGRSPMKHCKQEQHRVNVCGNSCEWRAGVCHSEPAYPIKCAPSCWSWHQSHLGIFVPAGALK